MVFFFFLLPMPPAYRYDSLDLALIGFPDRFPLFLLTSGPDIAARETATRFGLLRPPPVRETATGEYQLLADFAPFLAMRELGLETTLCQIIPASTPKVELLSLQALLLRQTGETSPVIHAWMASMAHAILDESEVLSLLALMGYKPQRYLCKELIDLLQLEPAVLLALHQGRLALKASRLLSLLAPEDQRQAVEIISAYRLGGSKQQKFLEMLIELVMRDKRTVTELVDAWLPHEDETSNLPQRAQGLLDHLQTICFPHRSAAEKTFQELVRSLQIPENITLGHSLSFEDDSLEVRLRFIDRESLLYHWPNLRAMVA